MKKFIKGILVFGGLLFLNFTVCATDSVIETNSTIIINGEVQTFSIPTILYNDRTMVPMRELFEKLNATVEWLPEEKGIIAKTDTKIIEMHIDDYWTFCNGIDIYVDVPPILYEERTMIPLRFVGEQLNLHVVWDGESNFISLENLGETTLGYAERIYSESEHITQKYSGELINGIPNGVGTIEYYHGGAAFLAEKGCFANWEKNGFVSSEFILGYSDDTKGVMMRSGFYSNGVQNGLGWCTDTEGNYFYGKYENGKLFGISSIEFANGNIYLGDVFSGDSYYWEDEMKDLSFEAIPHGYGSMVFEDNFMYEGYWQYDELHGEGVFYWPNGNVLEKGTYKNGNLNGWGQYYYENGRLMYEGDFADGNFHGEGSSYNENGNLIYEGGYYMDKPSGTGKFYSSNGMLLYEGSLLDGKPSGFGKEYYENGILFYNGQYAQGNQNGVGTMYYDDGTVYYTGMFKDGVLSGLGKLIYKNGVYDEGTFEDNLIVKGRRYYNGALVHDGNFEYGVPVAEKQPPPKVSLPTFTPPNNSGSSKNSSNLIDVDFMLVRLEYFISESAASSRDFRGSLPYMTTDAGGYLYVGEYAYVHVLINPSNATNKKLTWKSSNPSVVEVWGESSSGAYIEAKKAGGTAKITITAHNGKESVLTIDTRKR